ncbi:uncharacterized protein LOC123904965 isoform X2 [Trifolium pratense]|uniref:uncharacterized protein LOC123904965 isoform X2 n=1 Tax=Trifolium pratense TaxID=57577 RepID=UPI001E6913DD|nr:uncharacterized protein LOC123904965 isoform X2 [Trifolium pratense]
MKSFSASQEKLRFIISQASIQFCPSFNPVKCGKQPDLLHLHNWETSIAGSLFWDIFVNKVLLRDPTDEHAVPVVEELQRRLPKLSDIRQQQGDGKEYLGGQQDAEAAEDD